MVSTLVCPLVAGAPGVASVPRPFRLDRNVGVSWSGQLPAPVFHPRLAQPAGQSTAGTVALPAGYLYAAIYRLVYGSAARWLCSTQCQPEPAYSPGVRYL